MFRFFHFFTRSQNSCLFIVYTRHTTVYRLRHYTSYRQTKFDIWKELNGGRERDWIGLCSVLRPLQHSIGYMGDGFYRSKDPANSIEVLKENLQKTNQTTETTQNRHA